MERHYKFAFHGLPVYDPGFEAPQVEYSQAPMSTGVVQFLGHIVYGGVVGIAASLIMIVIA